MQQDFNVQVVKETDWDADAYGNRWYSVKFKELEQAVLWKAKAMPVVDSVVYGHLEASKSGKSKIFKKDAKPDGFTPQHRAQQADLQQTAAPLDIYQQLQRIEEKLDKLLGVDEGLATEKAQPRDWNSVGKDKVYNSTEMPPDFGLPPDDISDLEPM